MAVYQTLFVAIMRMPIFFGPLGKRFGSGIFWNLIGTVFTQGSVFLVAVILARIFGKEAFGEFSMVLSTLLTLSTIAQVSTGITATKYVAEFRDKDTLRTGRILGMCSILTLVTGVVGTGLLFFGANFLAENLLKAPQIATSISIAAAFVFFSVMNGYQIGALAGLESFKSISFYGALLGVLHVIVCVIGAKIWGLHGALWGLSVSALSRWIVYGVVLRRETKKRNIKIQWKGGLQERKLFLGFALPAALAGLTSMPAVWLGNAFLVQQQNGFAEMGLYSAAITLRTMVLFLPMILNNVAISMINSHKGQKNQKSYRASFNHNLALTFGLAVAGSLVMWFVGESALRVFGSDFVGENVKAMIAIMSISVIFEVLGIAVYQLIQSHEKMWHSFFIIALPRDLVVVLAAYHFTQQYGAAGLAGAFAIGYLLALITKVGLVYSMNLQNKV